jgi:hypothetical protein
MDWSDIKKILWTWLALPLTALDWAIAWHRVPLRVGMKFGSDGRPTSWSPREGALKFDLVFLTGMLVFATLVAFFIAFAQPGKGRYAPWVVMFVGGLAFVLLNGVLWLYQVQ